MILSESPLGELVLFTFWLTMKSTSEMPASRVSLVMRIRQGGTQESDALAELCSLYVSPVYAYLRRRQVPPHDAEDLTLGFFEQVVRKRLFARMDPARGRIRSFLIGCLEDFWKDSKRRDRAQKRGGGQITISFDATDAENRYRDEPADHRTPEGVFDRQCALEALSRTLQCLAHEYDAKGQRAVFDAVKGVLQGDALDRSYAEIAASVGTTEGALKVVVLRMRRRFGELLRQVVSNTVMASADVEAELRALTEALSN